MSLAVFHIFLAPSVAPAPPLNTTFPWPYCYYLHTSLSSSVPSIYPPLALLPPFLGLLSLPYPPFLSAPCLPFFFRPLVPFSWSPPTNPWPPFPPDPSLSFSPRSLLFFYFVPSLSVVLHPLRLRSPFHRTPLPPSQELLMFLLPPSLFPPS